VCVFGAALLDKAWERMAWSWAFLSSWEFQDRVNCCTTLGGVSNIIIGEFWSVGSGFLLVDHGTVQLLLITCTTTILRTFSFLVLHVE